jgi:hypothetical protein
MGTTAGLAMATGALTVRLSALAALTKGAARRGVTAPTTTGTVTIGASKPNMFHGGDIEYAEGFSNPQRTFGCKSLFLLRASAAFLNCPDPVTLERDALL